MTKEEADLLVEQIRAYVVALSNAVLVVDQRRRIFEPLIRDEGVRVKVSSSPSHSA